MHKIFDAHFHIIDPNYPLDKNNGFLPDPYTAQQYLNELRKLNIEDVGGVVVSGSFQGYHQEYFKAAFDALGSNFVGITQVQSNISDQELKRLNEVGIRGIRFNIFRGLNASLDEIKRLSNRVYDLFGWSTEFYIDLSQPSEELLKLIISLPKTSVDHLGMRRATDRLKRLLASGVPVRVTGFGRIEYEREGLKELLPELWKENPNGLMFGTDLPSTRASYRFADRDIKLVEDAFENDSSITNKIFYQNGMNWYLGKSI